MSHCIDICIGSQKFGACAMSLWNCYYSEFGHSRSNCVDKRRGSENLAALGSRCMGNVGAADPEKYASHARMSPRQISSFQIWTWTSILYVCLLTIGTLGSTPLGHGRHCGWMTYPLEHAPTMPNLMVLVKWKRYRHKCIDQPGNCPVTTRPYLAF